MSEGTPKSQTKIVVPDGSPARPQTGTHHTSHTLPRLSTPPIPVPTRFFDRRAPNLTCPRAAHRVRTHARALAAPKFDFGDRRDVVPRESYRADIRADARRVLALIVPRLQVRHFGWISIFARSPLFRVTSFDTPERVAS